MVRGVCRFHTAGSANANANAAAGAMPSRPISYRKAVRESDPRPGRPARMHVRTHVVHAHRTPGHRGIAFVPLLPLC
ncbi:hypothetical protein CBM2633_A50440 [Cupriavidus taiwanensis]|uniref:Uncharacterized protein n=1 Tax=Cupriavidus taiwanensis TaxID=164546 RepID=A0A976ATL1_9BURK|nr:hypothetical protein CBM2615_A130098 [Cupriavidus taiwanensis]SOZ50899.1 hypothetical protein CBM2614_A130098 [Cupriavidus taiwanensis]SOZ53564.1 hypothetical protein CBM2613_A130097 [Cupriavidus taiwanensis]SPA00418.1 hypothetical protein CBM2626_A60244 [Cupriavidus taiwanensis]SPA14554.1 hypothetical protein CBM2633_A50440 [Cupriavidus taiwanensis]